MKDFKKTFTNEVLTEFYFGLGFGITRIDKKTLIILPFILILIIEEELYQ